MAKNYDNTCICITVKKTQEHRACMVGPLTALVGLVWQMTSYIDIVMLIAVLDPKIWFSG